MDKHSDQLAIHWVWEGLTLESIVEAAFWLETARGETPKKPKN